MGIRAGLLTEDVDIYRATITKNQYGEDSEVWSKVWATRSRVIQQSANRQTENSEVRMAYQKRFEMRIYVDVTDIDRLKWQDKMWRIVSIDKDRMNGLITIDAELIND